MTLRILWDAYKVSSINIKGATAREVCLAEMPNICMWLKLLPNQIIIFVCYLNDQLCLSILINNK